MDLRYLIFERRLSNFALFEEANLEDPLSKLNFRKTRKAKSSGVLGF